MREEKARLPVVYIQVESTWSPKKVGCRGLELSHQGRVREGFLEEVALGLGLRMDEMYLRDGGRHSRHSLNKGPEVGECAQFSGTAAVSLSAQG